MSQRVPILVVASTLFLTSCIVLVRKVDVRELPKGAVTFVTAPAKAHLIDGSVIVYRNGLSVSRDSLLGAGERFNVSLSPLGVVRAVPLDSVLGMESFHERIKPAESVLLTVPASIATGFGAALAMVAIFGSCPTFYTDSAGVRRLEAEGYSYSIAPIFEMRDVDPLRGRAAGGIYRIEMLNEALETHYTNHLELITVAHRPTQRLLSDQSQGPVLIESAKAARAVRDRAGRDAARELQAADGRVFSSARSQLAGANTDALHDALNFTFDAIDADSAAIVIKLRNSLLSTVLLYDVMLGDGGASTIDWLGRRMEEVGPAAELAKWYARTMGIRVDVLRGGEWRPAGRLPDTGPIAWKDVAVVVPVTRGIPVQVRFTFPIDGWRIDHVALARMERSVDATVTPVTRALHSNSTLNDSIRAMLQEPDTRYLITEPGQRVVFEFDVPREQLGKQQSHLLVSQGYYIEWLRQDWLKRAPRKAFTPDDAALLDAIVRWRSRKPSFEAQFYSTAIKVN